MPAPASKQIMADAGYVGWDMGSCDWLLQGKDLDSIHPSLQRQAILNMAYGLYEVVPGRIYQVRGFDLANISFVKGDTGWILFDVGTVKETARAALALVNEKLGKRPVVAIVYSHSHADHYGGVRGIVEEADVRSGKVPVIAPVGFLEHAIAETVYTGNVMNRRLYFQYGVLLPRSPFGQVDQSIGKNFWTVEPSVSVSWLSSRIGLEVTAFAGLDFNTRDDATDYESGDVFHLDATVAEHLSLGSVGVVGVGATASHLDGDSDADPGSPSY